VNNVFLEKIEVPQYEAASFVLDSVPTSIQVVAYKDGTDWASQTLVAVGPPMKIVLEREYPQSDVSIFSNGQDAAIFTASVVDSNGNPVRWAVNLITFSITSGPGTILGTGNGDPSDHMPDQGPNRQFWQGFARVVVGTTMSSNADVITVTATSPGLASASATISTIPMTGVKYL